MKIKAYLTIYLTLSLTALLAVAMVLLAGIRKNTARMEEELALIRQDGLFWRNIIRNFQAV